jgi:ATP-dependent Lhr-like helicase
MVNADSFAGLRAMLLPASKRASNDKKRRRGAGPTMEEAGRWALVRPASSILEPAVDTPAAPQRRRKLDPETLEHIAMTLLRRYGVMFWRLLEREAAWMPSWRELLPVYHRLEAAARSAAGVSWPASRANSSRCRKRSRCCARCAGGPWMGRWSASPASIR